MLVYRGYSVNPLTVSLYYLKKIVEHFGLPGLFELQGTEVFIVNLNKKST